MSAIPSQYPVTLNDGARDYQVFNASEFVNAVYKYGHSIKAEEQAEPDVSADSSAE